MKASFGMDQNIMGLVLKKTDGVTGQICSPGYHGNHIKSENPPFGPVVASEKAINFDVKRQLLSKSCPTKRSFDGAPYFKRCDVNIKNDN